MEEQVRREGRVKRVDEVVGSADEVRGQDMMGEMVRDEVGERGEK